MRALALSLIALAACTSVPEVDTSVAPVVGADIDTGDPGVVALLTSGGSVFCTGTLVAPMSILTAAHCVADAGGDPAISAFFGDDTRAGGRRVSINAAITHPGWTGDIAGGHDLAVLELVAPQSLDLIKPMNTIDLATQIGAPYRVVGFGIHDRTTRELDGKKRVGHMTITNTTGDYIEVHDVDADEATAICQGDSGGPGFITVGGVEVLAGIHTYSIQGCFNPSGDSRPDLYMTSFVQPTIDAHDLTCRADGRCIRVGCGHDPDCEPCGPEGTCTAGCATPDPDCATGTLGDICLIDTQCISGLCLPSSVDTHARFCSQACSGASDCPVAGMTCDAVSGRGMVCNFRGDPPGAIGQSCTQARECAAYVCDDNLCTYECDIPRGLLCPDDYACDSKDGGTTYRCFPMPVTDGGCCSSSGSGATTWLSALALAGWLARRRRAVAPTAAKPAMVDA